MHLIIFPLFMYLVAAAPILLFWPQRGLCQKNYWLAIVSSMLGLVVGFVLLLLLQDHIHPGISMYFMFFVLPLAFAISSVHKFGRAGKSLSKAESVMSLTPKVALKYFCVAVSIALVAAVAFALIIGVDHAHIAIASAVVLPISMACYLIRSNYLISLNAAGALKSSFVVSIFLFVSSFILGPYFLVALPIVLFGGLSSFIFHYLMSLPQKPNNSSKRDAVTGAPS